MKTANRITAVSLGGSATVLLIWLLDINPAAEVVVALTTVITFIVQVLWSLLRLDRWTGKQAAILLIPLVLIAPDALAVPGTYTVTPTFNAPAEGTPTGYTLYRDCDLADQSLGAATAIGVVTSGQAVPIAGDSAVAIDLCVVPFDAQGTFPFDEVITIIGEGRSPVQNFQLNCTFVEDTPDGTDYACRLQ